MAGADVETPGGPAEGAWSGSAGSLERDRGPILKDTSNTEPRGTQSLLVAAANILNTFNIHVDVVITGVSTPTVLPVTSSTNFKFYSSARCARVVYSRAKVGYLLCAGTSRQKSPSKCTLWHLRIKSNYKYYRIQGPYLKFVSPEMLGSGFRVTLEFFT